MTFNNNTPRDVIIINRIVENSKIFDMERLTRAVWIITKLQKEIVMARKCDRGIQEQPSF